MNRMTEREYANTRGGDDCQNRAARRYEKCSYLWHYFRRFETLRSRRSLWLSLYPSACFSAADDVPRDRSLVPLSPSTPYVSSFLPPYCRHFAKRPSVLTSSPLLFSLSIARLHLPTISSSFIALSHSISHSGSGAPPSSAGAAQRGDSPTSAGTTLMLH